MVSICKEMQQNRTFRCHLSESDADSMIGQKNHEAQTESGKNEGKNVTSNNANDPAQTNTSEMDVHTLETRIVSKVRSRVDNVITTVETRVQDTLSSAIESSVILRVKLVLKSVNVSAGLDLDSGVPDLDQTDISGNIERHQMIASSRINSNTNLNETEETRGYNTAEGGDLSINRRNFDRQTYTYHTCTFGSS